MALFEWEKQDLCGEHQLAMSIWGLFKTLQGNVLFRTFHLLSVGRLLS